MLRTLLAWLLLLGLVQAQEPAPTPTTPAAKLQRAIQAARASGRLANLAETQYLIADGIGYTVEVDVSETRILVRSTVRYREHHAPFETQELELSPDGVVRAFSAGRWVPAQPGSETRARVDGETLRWELAATRRSGEGDPVHSGTLPWTEQHLPGLATDLLWPLLAQDPALTCTRVTLYAPLLTDPYDPTLRRGDAPPADPRAPATAATVSVTRAADGLLTVRAGETVTALELRGHRLRRLRFAPQAPRFEAVSEEAFWKALGDE